MILRPYQADAYEAVLESFLEFNTSLIVMPTGTGKTVVFSHIAKDFKTIKPILILAERKELVRQAAMKIQAITGEMPDIEMGDEVAEVASVFGRAKVIVATIQTIHRRLAKYSRDYFGLIICDEAHHAVAATYRKVFDYFTCKVLGVTATPDRGDEEALGQVFESVPYVYELLQAIRDGWLVRVVEKRVTIKGLEFAGCHTTKGDFRDSELGGVIGEEKILHAIASVIVRETGDKKTLTFLPLVVNAEKMSEILNRHRPGSARWVCGKTPNDERAQTLKDYKNCEFQHLLNVGCFVEGFDEPGVEVVVIGRPTKSRALYSQMVGRGTRPLPGLVDGCDDATERCKTIAESDKPFIEVIDLVGNAGRHKLITAADILGGKYTDEVVERAAQAAEEAGDEGVDVIELMDDAASEIEAEHEAERQAEMERRRDLIARAVYETVTVDPFDALDLKPPRDYGWNRKRKPTVGQARYLGNRGVRTDGMKFSEASAVIQDIKRREINGLCGYAQAVRLSQAGLPNEVSAGEAAGMLINLARQRAKQQQVVA